jgi:hypothetical protein
MTKIYADSEVCRWHLARLNLEILEEITAGSPAVFHMPYPYDSDFDLMIEQAVSICPTVVILVSELHRDSTRFIINHQHTRIKYFICGVIDGYANKFWMDWFVTTCDFYKDIDTLTQLTPYKVKPKYFDLLLGWRKPHRDIAYNFIVENNLIDKVIMTYLTDRSKTIDQQGIWEVDIPDGTFNTITQINHLGKSITLSQIIPIDIYKDSAYTVVCETNYDNHYNFYTEKIVKPILAERLFIVFSGQHYLRNLRRLGFKTFDGIVDETYDNIADNDQRFKSACEQITYLINQSQEEILAKIRPITEHNKRVMLATDWYGDFLKELQAVLLDHTRQN